jgi:hypothetical protein
MPLYYLKVQTLVTSASTEKVTMWKNSEVKRVISEYSVGVGQVGW